jgi:hypothetical protein
MHAFSAPRLTRAAIGLAAVSAFAIAPMAAQALPGDLSGTLGAGSLTNSTPVLTDFGSVTLNGVAQDVYTPVGTMNVNDATGSDAGYTVSVEATAPKVDGDAALAGTNGSIMMTPQAITATSGNANANPPVPSTATPTQIIATPFTLDTAAPNAGQGSWDTRADSTTSPGPGVGSSHATGNSLHVVIPGDASAGAYTSTLTFTTAPLG